MKYSHTVIICLGPAQVSSVNQNMHFSEVENLPGRAAAGDRGGVEVTHKEVGGWRCLAGSVPGAGGRGNGDVNFRPQYLNICDLSALLLCSLFAFYKFGIWFPVCP